MPLPTQPLVQERTPERIRALIYGAPGAGKTTFAAGWFPKQNLIIDLEGGTRFLSGENFIVRPKTYAEFQSTVLDLAKGNHQFKTVTIDTIDALVRMADSEAARSYGKSAAALVEFGKGLTERDARILADLHRLTSSDLGLLLLSHVVEVSSESEEDDATKFAPAVDKRLRTILMGDVEFLWAARALPKRELIVGPHAKYEAKSWARGLPDRLPTDPKVVYTELKKAMA